ncbi:hypothetical protein SAMD00023353_1400990 [Rosellinia necatrix]|uniref:Uncharacterized protein n=1 Tax=Rosellinia necatrix TaxID=77044 RepID=A0A1S8A6X5_ROSNE|nr:hypothetical protein SAMD00023353_1400990 [Rosellinia necatrix]
MIVPTAKVLEGMWEVELRSPNPPNPSAHNARLIITVVIATPLQTNDERIHNPGPRLTREDLYFSCQIPISCMVVSRRTRGSTVRQPAPSRHPYDP